MVKKGDKLLQLGGLEPKEYWSLFLAYVFDETNQQCNGKNLLEIGKKIVEKLKGSPLAAKTVGRLLRENLTVDHWTKVLESKEWESQTSDHDIMPALKLSYDHLPFHLQQCFSSCALFPEDYKFDCEELINFWIGLDILRPGHRTKSIEDIGRQNLNDLVNYGFFKKETDDLGTHYYVMHDLLHDLALNVSSQECLHIASSSPRAVDIASSVYHLSISISDPSDIKDGVLEEKFRKELDKIRNIIKFENLRTLMLFGNYFDASFVHIFSDLFKDAKSLRVLYLTTMHYPLESLLCNFPKLVHLRYLRLVAFYGSNEHLPRYILRFYQLRVLDIKHWHGYYSLHRDMTNLVKLRHFLVPYDSKVHSGIRNVGKLHSLQELRSFEVRKESSGFELRELAKLEDLGGSLGIYNLENALVNEAHEAKLLYKNHLQKLTLGWKKGRPDANPAAEDHVLESLRPHGNLHDLCIDGHGGSTCPTWLGTNLSTKGLDAFRLENTDWEFLPPLGELYLVRETGEEYYGCIRGPTFRNLKRLELIGLPRFRRWVANEACPWYFSLIEVLTVKDCPQLTELPFSSYTCYPSERDLNVTWFPRLREIEIENCLKLLSLPPIPYNHTLCSVTLRRVGRSLEVLHYSNEKKHLTIRGNDALPSLDESVLAFDNLAHLGTLCIKDCPSLAEKRLQMLASLKTLEIEGSSIMFPPLVKSDVKWHLPVTCLEIKTWSASGKELARLLSHLPELSRLSIYRCDEIIWLGVEADQQEMAPSLSLSSSSAVKLQDTHAIAQEVEAEEVVVPQQQPQEDDDDDDDDDGLLLLPAHLSDSLQELSIGWCPELVLTAQNSGAGGRGGLQAVRSLNKIEIKSCPKFLSAHTASDLSSCCPFPSSLQHLTLDGRMEGMGTTSNLTSLQELRVKNWGEDLSCRGQWPLLTQCSPEFLQVSNSPKFFSGWDPAQVLQREQEQHSSKLQELWTDDIAGVLAAPICRLLSFSLTELSFDHCTKEVEHFTKEQEEAFSLLTSLQKLQFLHCDNLRCLPGRRLDRLTNLKKLQIDVCPAIRSLHKNGLPSSLQELAVYGCINLRCLPAGLHKLTSLKRLKIDRCPAIQSLPKNGLPISLQELDVNGCDKLRCFPAGLNKLTNLKTLKISGCKAVRPLPKNGLPSSLTVLNVEFANKELRQQCRRLIGSIPTIEL